jgi:hypothetical protein
MHKKYPKDTFLQAGPYPSTLPAFEEEFGKQLFDQLSPETTARLDALLEPPSPGSVGVPLRDLRADPDPVSIATSEEESSKLALLPSLEVPPNLFGRISLRIVKGYRRRVAVEEVHGLKRHPATIRMTLLSAFCRLRTGELIDTLGTLLIDMVHRVAHRAEVRSSGNGSPTTNACRARATCSFG